MIHCCFSGGPSGARTLDPRINDPIRKKRINQRAPRVGPPRAPTWHHTERMNRSWSDCSRPNLDEVISGVERADLLLLGRVVEHLLGRREVGGRPRAALPAIVIPGRLGAKHPIWPGCASARLMLSQLGRRSRSRATCGRWDWDPQQPTPCSIAATRKTRGLLSAYRVPLCFLLCLLLIIPSLWRGFPTLDLSTQQRGTRYRRGSRRPELARSPNEQVQLLRWAVGSP